MKRNTLLSGCLLSLVSFACDPARLLGLDPYKSLGTFDTKKQAQHEALAHVLSHYNGLPENDFYRVSYSFRDVDPSLGNRHAIWYSRKEQRLGVEIDIHSGIICAWQKVDKNTLTQVVQASKGLAGVDSLAQSEFNTSSCR